MMNASIRERNLASRSFAISHEHWIVSDRMQWNEHAGLVLIDIELTIVY